MVTRGLIHLYNSYGSSSQVINLSISIQIVVHHDDWSPSFITHIKSSWRQLPFTPLIHINSSSSFCPIVSYDDI